MESAEGVVAQMQLIGLRPDEETYTNLSCGYAKTGDLKSIRAILDGMQTAYTPLSAHGIFQVIYDLAINGHEEQADKLFGYLNKSHGYNNDAINVILRLVNNNQDDVAFKILQSMPSANGDFFIKQMVIANRPIEKIVEFCERLPRTGANDGAFNSLIYQVSDYWSTDQIYDTLRICKSKSVGLTAHSVAPLMRIEAANGSIDKVIHFMTNELEIKQSLKIIRDHIVPNMNITNPVDAVMTLRKSNVPFSTAISSVIYHSLQSNDMKAAVAVTHHFNNFLSPSAFQEPLISALNATGDFESYITIIRYIYDNYYNQKSGGESYFTEYYDNRNSAIGHIMYSTLISLAPENRLRSFTKILKGLIAEGLTISKVEAERIELHLKLTITTDISKLLAQLASGNLRPVEREKHPKRLSSEGLESFIDFQEKRGNDTTRLRKRLEQQQQKQSETAKYVQKYKNENRPIPEGKYVQLIEEYVGSHDWENVLNTFEMARAAYPDFAIKDSFKIMYVVQLLLKNGQTDAGLRFLETNRKKSHEFMSDEKMMRFRVLCGQMLNSLAETGNVEDVQRMFNSFIKNNHIRVVNILLHPLVKVHLINNDTNTAVDVFAALANEYKMTPLRAELARSLILAGDTIILQCMIDICVNIFGKHVAMLDLAFAYLDCDRVTAARKIFENPNLSIDRKRIIERSDRYQKSDRVENLEALLEATKNLPNFNRGELSYKLLECYCVKNMPEKALDVWHRMQEDNETPSERFLNKLGTFLMAKNVEVPFSIPNVEWRDETNLILEAKTKSAPTHIKNSIKLANALKTNDLERIRRAYRQLRSTDEISPRAYNSLVQAFFAANDLSEAKGIVVAMFKKNIQPVKHIFEEFLAKIAAAGDVQAFGELSSLMSNSYRNECAFYKMYCDAFEASEQRDDILESLIYDFNQVYVSNEKPRLQEDSLHIALTNLLLRNHDLVPTCRYFQKSFLGYTNELKIFLS